MSAFYAITPSCTLAELIRRTESGEVASALSQQGMHPHDVSAKTLMFHNAAQRLLAAGISADLPAAAFWVPGRIEVAGKHTDYAGGRSLLCAATRGFAGVSVDRGDSTARALGSFALSGLRAEAELRVSEACEAPESAPWASHLAAAIRRLAGNFGIDRGVDLAFECDLPEASGMSSSSAVICLAFLALARRNRLASHPKAVRWLGTPEELCHYLGCIENGQDCGSELRGHRGVGTFGGSEDHTAIMCCEARRLRLYAFCPTRLLSSFELSPAVRLVIGVSGVTAEKNAGRLHDYNNAATLAQHSAAAVQPHLERAAAAAAQPPNPEASRSTPTLASVVSGTAALLQTSASHESVRAWILERLSEAEQGLDGNPGAGALADRFEQFFEENELIVPQLSDALQRGAMEEAGPLVDRSQRLTVTKLRNTVPETEWMPAEARRLGAVAASAFGAGFGGSCWALVRTEDADAFCQQWSDAYSAHFPQRVGARFFSMAPAPGALCI